MSKYYILSKKNIIREAISHILDVLNNGSYKSFILFILNKFSIELP